MADFEHRLAMEWRPRPFSELELEELQRLTFDYFLKETNPENGLVPDSTRQGAPCSIAPTGFALAAYPVGVERGFITRDYAISRTLTSLRFFWNSQQGPEPDATGYKGFYYHFLDMKTGRRMFDCELSTIDSTFVIAGALTAAEYFNRDTEKEGEIRDLATALYRRTDWQWAQNSADTVTHGWTPEHGFLKYRWDGYNEALILYVLGLASPTHPLPEESYQAWTKTYEWRSLYGYDFLYAGPLFIHQLSHMWIDFRLIQDDYMQQKGIDYFENSRRATYAQQQYAIENPRGFKGYGEFIWGFTASDGPGPAIEKIEGKERQFYDYINRGIPDGPDDGTLAPWAVIASLPFAPEIILPSIRYFDQSFPEMTSKYGFKCSFNPTFAGASNNGWISKGYYGLDQGPIVLMIENYRSGFIWQLMRSCPYIVTGLRRAGFSGGWLRKLCTNGTLTSRHRGRTPIEVTVTTETEISKLSPGQLIPNFRLWAANQQRQVGPWDYKQHRDLVLIFFRSLECLKCQQLLREISEHYHEYQQMEAEVLAISSDEIEYLRQRAQELALPFPVLSDSEGGVTDLYVKHIEQRADTAAFETAIFVADRWGAVFSTRIIERDQDLPAEAEIRDWLEFIELQCEECFPSEWPL